MKATVVYHGKSFAVDTSHPSTDGLWIPVQDLEELSGWLLRTEGVCKDDSCVPIPPGRYAEFVRNAHFNLAALSRLLGETIVQTDDRSAWVINEPLPKADAQDQSLKAPDFALPDLEGRIHRLSDYRGNKVFFVTWASW